MILGEICREAGLPDGVVNVLTGPGKEVGRRSPPIPASTRSPSPGRRRPGGASGAFGGNHQEGLPRARRQEPKHRLPGHESRRGGRRFPLRHLHQCRSCCTARTRLFCTSISRPVPEPSCARRQYPRRRSTRARDADGSRHLADEANRILTYCQRAKEEGCWSPAASGSPRAISPPAISWPRPSSTACARTCISPRRRSSARCWR